MGVFIDSNIDTGRCFRFDARSAENLKTRASIYITVYKNNHEYSNAILICLKLFICQLCFALFLGNSLLSTTLALNKFCILFCDWSKYRVCFPVDKRTQLIGFKTKTIDRLFFINFQIRNFCKNTIVPNGLFLSFRTEI